MSNTDNFEIRWAKSRAALAKANAINKRTVFVAMAAANLTRVNVSFDGEGDSGQIEHLSALTDDAVCELPEINVTIQRVDYGSEFASRSERRNPFRSGSRGGLATPAQ